VYETNLWEVVTTHCVSDTESVVLKDSGIQREASGDGVYRVVTTGNIIYGKRIAPWHVTGECGQPLDWKMGATSKGRVLKIGDAIGHPHSGNSALEWAGSGGATMRGNAPAEEGYVSRVWGVELTVTEERLTATYHAGTFDGTNTVWTLRNSKRTHLGTIPEGIGVASTRRTCDGCPQCETRQESTQTSGE
jgi:hypothetical protein